MHSTAKISARLSAVVREDVRPLVHLAWPVMATEMAWMAMNIVDTMLVGRVGAQAIGAVSVGGNLFFAVTLFGGGALFGLDHTVSHAHGAGRHDDVRRATVHGLALAAILCVPCGLALWLLALHVDRLGMDPELAHETSRYLLMLAPSAVPILFFIALRRSLQAVGVVRPILLLAIGGNLLNAALAWMLIFGHFGLPALGSQGAALATTLTRFGLLGALVWLVVVHAPAAATPWRRSDWRLDPARLRSLFELGLPAALQMSLEVGVFAVATTLAAQFGAVAIAAHQITLSLASLAFMVPLGLASAAGVRVGLALGAGDPQEAVRRGWTAIALGATVMLVGLTSFVTIPRLLVRLFTTDPTVIDTGASLLRVAAGFQLFDGVQVVATGALRGTGNTRTAMVANLLGHWAVGLPVGCGLAFGAGLGVYGLWIGLSTGLVLVAVRLVFAWARCATRLARGSAAGQGPSAAQRSAIA